MACEEDGVLIKVINRHRFKEKPWWHVPLCKKHMLVFAERGFSALVKSNRTARKYMIDNGWRSERSGFRRNALDWESV